MRYIDEKFKDNDPKSTVEKIQNILKELGVEVHEKWNQSGVEHCHSLILSGGNGCPTANGKGISEDLARASGYGEFIERLQGGLFFCKFQSLSGIDEMNVHTFAPDAKYMTVDELIKNGQWMDHIINEYADLNLTREGIAEHCRAYACTEDDRILTVPFYSLFEDQYVYLPVGFLEQMYTTNGCCAGNSKEEAWVHALSEIMERHSSIEAVTKGTAYPRIPESTLEKFTTVSQILKQIRESGEYDVQIFDYSMGSGFPVVSTRLISRRTHSYRVNVAADPVLEIAIQRTLTELFQGKNMQNITQRHDGRILNNVEDFPPISNVINQLEISGGLYTADYFADELTCTKEPAVFADFSGKTNKELLQYMLDLYRKMGKQIYVRNLSYLGFPSYKFVVPGFSETRALRLQELLPEYAIAHESAKTLRNAAAASDEDLSWMLIHNDMIRTIISQNSIFGRLAGIPLAGEANSLLPYVTRAYAAFRLKRYSDAIRFLSVCVRNESLNPEDRGYFACVNQYVEMKASQIEDEKIKAILYKFFETRYPDQLYKTLTQGKTPYDDYLISCDYKNCENCRYRSACSYDFVKQMNIRAGEEYRKFTAGQDRSEFAI